MHIKDSLASRKQIESRVRRFKEKVNFKVFDCKITEFLKKRNNLKTVLNLIRTFLLKKVN